MTINLGSTRRWAGRAGVVERTIAKLKSRGQPKLTEQQRNLLACAAGEANGVEVRGQHRAVARRLAAAGFGTFTDEGIAGRFTSNEAGRADAAVQNEADRG